MPKSILLPPADFLGKLQAEAARQARLHEHRFFPPQLDFLTSFIGRYPWQTSGALALLTALVLELL
ncbi:MAG TPA: hypothetical protein VD999_02420 [Vitreimonas sp.]|nr:hypothetical protein [Vitreimonas sp.]